MVNKIILVFPRRFWPQEMFFGRTTESDKGRGEFFMFASKPGSTILYAYLVGEAALLSDYLNGETMCQKCMDVLTRIFGQDTPKVWRTVSFVIRVETKWAFTLKFRYITALKYLYCLICRPRRSW